MLRRIFPLLIAALIPLLGHTAPLPEEAPLQPELKTLAERFSNLRKRLPESRLPDAEVFHKGIVWALRYEESLTPADLALLRRSLARGNERAAALEAGELPWGKKAGRLVRGYRSAVDGSVQPYGLIVPRSYDPGKPIRLDVVLHGSTRPRGLSELRFMAPFDQGDTGGSGPDVDYIELHPLGRVENCYRWAGETDVFEAIEDVCRSYAIDRRRIVLRGMSMGASGTWHLGLKHPDRFAVLGPYCGYVDTHEFSRTPLPNFVKVGPLPPVQEKMLHMLDSVDYAANGGAVLIVAAMGEKDVFFQAHEIMARAMERDGLTLINLISPGTGHVQDPVTHAEQMRMIRERVERPPAVSEYARLTTWTLKYNRCKWLEILALGKHYERADIEGRVTHDGSLVIAPYRNIQAFAVDSKALTRRFFVNSQEVRLPRNPGKRLIFSRRGRRWVRVNRPPAGKSPGLQGPIDDAFTRPFLCVRGTGEAWNPAVGAWAEANLQRFAYEWHRYFRGDLPVKDDTEVTETDLRSFNLILFGDPGSNRWIRLALPDLPLDWGRKTLRMGPERFPAAEHAPALIYPSPFPGAGGRYVVLNSGHTFHEQELASLNYLLFPRLGDWAVVRVRASEPLREEFVRTGLFDERWRFLP